MVIDAVTLSISSRILSTSTASDDSVLRRCLEDYRVLPEQSIVNRGIYGYIRHPIYTGDILLLFGLELALNSWLVLGVPVLIIIIVRQALAEEEILSKSFSDYDAYRARTNRFIPFIA